MKSSWTPYDDAQNKKYSSLRSMKWLQTVIVILALATHYLIV
jgi:hypothetical protein